MPRRPNNKPTNIYWLYDTRPETIAACGSPLGKPFYCGKTVSRIEYRLTAHKQCALLHPNRKVSARIIECGDNVRSVLTEIVPVGEDWCARERHWISILRYTSDDALNASDGGDGAPGNIQSAEQRAKMSAFMKGRKFSAATLARMSERMKGSSIRKGKKLSPEKSARLGAMRLGKKRGPHSEAHRLAIGAAQKGKTIPEEQRAKMRAAWLRRKTRGPAVSDETRAKLSATSKGRVFTPEHCARIKEAWVRRKARATAVDNT